MESKAYCPCCSEICSVEIESHGRSRKYTCVVCGYGWIVDSYGTRKEFSVKMQKVAIEKVYCLVWANYSIIEVDTLPSELAKRLDIGGIDKVLFASDGHIIQVGQRFREHDVWDNPFYRDFTIREAELDRHLAALRNGGTVPAFYSYGYATEDEKDFRQFYIVKYREFLEGVGRDHRLHFMTPKKRGQERFYYESWADVPSQYIAFVYPEEFSL